MFHHNYLRAAYRFSTLASTSEQNWRGSNMFAEQPVNGLKLGHVRVKVLQGQTGDKESRRRGRGKAGAPICTFAR